MTYRQYLLLLSVGYIKKDKDYYVGRSEDKYLYNCKNASVLTPCGNCAISDELNLIDSSSVECDSNIFPELSFILKECSKYLSNDTRYHITSEFSDGDMEIDCIHYLDAIIFRFSYGSPLYKTGSASIVVIDKSLIIVNHKYIVNPAIFVNYVCLVVQDILSKQHELGKNPAEKTIPVFCNVYNNIISKYKSI